MNWPDAAILKDNGRDFNGIERSRRNILNFRIRKFDLFQPTIQTMQRINFAI